MPQATSFGHVYQYSHTPSSIKLASNLQFLFMEQACAGKKKNQWQFAQNFHESIAISKMASTGNLPEFEFI